jgi:hypothetical protein
MIATSSSTSTSSSGITAPMNINAVIAHLVEMTPPQRKQFAQMHMDDPMMLSAAKFVDNQITKQAAAMSAQRMGAAPPPVNQQVVAQMSPQPPVPQAAPMPQAAPQQQAAPQPQGQAQPMPEDTGIAQLPAPNMEGMAGGGIVGYAEGGGPVAGVYVPNSVPPGAFIMGNMYTDPETGERGYLPGRGPGKGLSGYEGMTMGDIATKAKEKLEDFFVSGTYNKQKLAERRQAASAAKVPELLNKDAPAYTGPSVTARKDDKVKRNPDNYKPADAAPAEAPKEKKGIEQLRQETVAPRKEIPPSAAETPSQDLSLDRFMPAGSKRPSASDVEAINREQQKGAEEALSGFNADLAKRGKAMEGQEARITAREATSKDRLDTNTNMSLINAGLAMMQSSGKGLAGLAEGAQVGTKQYQAGLREFDNAKEKLDTARDLIEQYRRTEDTMNDKDRRALTKNINDTRAAGLQSLVNFDVKMYGEDIATARSKLEMTVKQQEGAADRASRERLSAQGEAGADRRNAASVAASAAAANRMPGEVRAVQLLGGGDYEKGLKKMAEIQAGKFNLPTKYADYVSDWVKAGGAINGPKMSMAEYAAQFTGGGSTMSNAGWGQAVKN